MQKGKEVFFLAFLIGFSQCVEASAEKLFFCQSCGACVYHDSKEINDKLVQAVASDDFWMARCALASGANINACIESGWTALMVAAGRGNVRMVRMLLDAGACVNRYDLEGPSALFLAALRGKTEVVRVLLDSDVDRAMLDVDLALAIALELQYDEIAWMLM